MMNSTQTGPINIGNPNEFKILQLAELIIDKINPSLPIIKKQLPIDGPIQRQPVIKLAKTKLAWQPKNELQDGLDHTITYFKEKLKMV